VSATFCAVTVTPLSVLVPRTNAHSLTAIALAPTDLVSENVVLLETETVVLPRSLL